MKICADLKEQMPEPIRQKFGERNCADAAYIHTEVSLDWRDRFRVFLTGKAHIRTVLYCENEPGCNAAQCDFSAPLFWRRVRLWLRLEKRMKMGVAEVGDSR